MHLCMGMHAFVCVQDGVCTNIYYYIEECLGEHSYIYIHPRESF